MATVKLKFRHSVIEGKEGVLYYQVTHRSKVRQVKTIYTLLSDEWESVTSTILAVGTRERIVQLLCIREKIGREMKMIRDMIADRDSRCRSYTVDELADDIRNMRPVQTVFCFMQLQIQRLLDVDRYE